MVQKKNSFASVRTRRRTKTTRKRTLLSQFRQHHSRKRTITRRKDAPLFVVAKSTRQVSAQTVNLSKNLRSHPKWLLLILKEEHLGMVIIYLLFFQFVIHLSGEWMVMLIFMYVLTFLCLLPIRSGGLEPNLSIPFQ
jgi:hypothetical protein